MSNTKRYRLTAEGRRQVFEIRQRLKNNDLEWPPTVDQLHLFFDLIPEKVRYDIESEAKSLGLNADRVKTSYLRQLVDIAIASEERLH